MLLTIVKRKTTIINKLLFTVWGVLSVLAAQQLLPSARPEIVQPAVDNPTSAAVTAADSLAAQTLGTSAESSGDSPSAASPPSATVTTRTYQEHVPPPISYTYTPPQTSTNSTSSATAPMQNNRGKSDQAPSNSQSSLKKLDAKQVNPCLPTGVCF